MRWGDFRRSDNIEDRTDGDAGGGGFSGGFPGGGGIRLGGGALVVIVIASLIFGVNPLEMLGMMEGGAPVAPPPQSQPAARPRPQAPPGYGPQRAPAPGQPRAEPSAGSVEGLRRGHPGRHRGRLGRRVQVDGRALRAAAPGALPQRDPFRVRARVGGDRDRSIARPIASSISTRRSSTSSRGASARPANSRRPT